MKIRFSILTLVSICLMTVLLVSCNMGPASSYDELGSKIANRYVIFDSKLEKFGYIDGSGQVVIPIQFDNVEEFSNGLAAVKTGEKCGFIDPTGTFVISPIYENVESFSEGLAAVSIDGEHWGFIDKKGNQVISPIYDYVYDFSDGVALVRMGSTKMYIDKKGKPITNTFNNNDWIYGDFRNGLALVCLDDKCGYVGKDLKFIVNPMYEDGEPYSEGLAAVQRNDRWGFIDTKGKEVIVPQYERVGDFHEGLAYFKVGEKYGYIDKKGKIVVNLQFDRVGDFRNGLAPVKVGEKFGFIDKSGNFAIPPQYDDYIFPDGDIILVVKDGSDAITYSYIDKNGNSVWDVTYKFFTYNTGFETSDDNSQWTFVNGSETNKWVIGSATSNNGQQSMYISYNGNNFYNGSYSSTVYAYHTFTLKEGGYDCSFDWKANGESSYDYMRVSLIPDDEPLTAGSLEAYKSGSTPDDWIDIDNGYRMNGQTNWTTKEKHLYVDDDGDYKLVFMWHNDGSFSFQPPAAIDNISFIESH